MFSPIPHGWPVTSAITASGYFFSMFSLFLRLDSFKPSIINFFAKTLNNVELDLREKFIATNVFANAFISVTYVLNGRKVTAKLLKRLEKMKI